MLKSLLNKWDNLVISMSTSRQDLIETYHNIYGRNPGNKSFEYHICKIMLYGHKDHGLYDSHWSEEIFDFLDNIKDLKLKSSNKYPEKRFIQDNFFYYIIDSPEILESRCKIIERFCMKKLTPPYPKGKNIDYNKAWKLYQDFASHCSLELSQGKISLITIEKYLKPLYDVEK